jgi:hypothetical protein
MTIPSNDPRPWHTLSTTTHYRDRWVGVVVDDVVAGAAACLVMHLGFALVGGSS